MKRQTETHEQEEATKVRTCELNSNDDKRRCWAGGARALVAPVWHTDPCGSPTLEEALAAELASAESDATSVVLSCRASLAASLTCACCHAAAVRLQEHKAVTILISERLKR